MSPEPQKAPPPRNTHGEFLSILENPANGFGRRAARLHEAIQEAVSIDDVKAITHKMIERARNGSEGAAKLVYQYAVGKPTLAGDPDRVDHDEWKMRMERPDSVDLCAGVEGRSPIHLAVNVGRAFDLKNMIEAKEQTQKAIEDDMRKPADEAMTGVDSKSRPAASHGRSKSRHARKGQKASSRGKR